MKMYTCIIFREIDGARQTYILDGEPTPKQVVMFPDFKRYAADDVIIFVTIQDNAIDEKDVPRLLRSWLDNGAGWVKLYLNGAQR